MGFVREVPITSTAQPALRIKDLALGYIQPLANHDFRWVFLTRFLMQQVCM
jgi:hypothetical protein